MELLEVVVNGIRYLFSIGKIAAKNKPAPYFLQWLATSNAKNTVPHQNFFGQNWKQKTSTLKNQEIKDSCFNSIPVACKL